MSRLVKATLAEQVYQELRSQIVAGRLVGGMRLLPNELADDMGVSPTPVKEACARLEADGLVMVSTRRGMVVRRFTHQDINELYDTRELLERGAVQRAFAHRSVTDALIDDLEEALAQHRRHAADNTLDGLSRALSYDRQFHRILVASAGIGMVSDWLERILSQTHTVFVSVPGHYERSVIDHRVILDALIARKPDAVLAAIDRHLMQSRRNALIQVDKLERQEAEA